MTPTIKLFITGDDERVQEAYEEIYSTYIIDKNLVTYCYEDKMANHKHSHVPPYAAGDNTDVHDLSAPQTKITYTNNGGNVHDFHLFIPVTIQYGWGHKKENTLKVWTVLSIQKTEGTGDTAAKKY